MRLSTPGSLADALVGQAYDSLFKERCGQGLLRGTDVDVLAPFAFVFTMAGIYLALEFARRVRNNDAVRPFTYWRASPWLPPVFHTSPGSVRRPDYVFCSNATKLGAARRI